MNKKTIIFLTLALLFSAAFAISYKLSVTQLNIFFWIAISFLFLHFTFVILAAILCERRSVAFLFLIPWVLFDLIFKTNFFYTLVFAVPTIALFTTINYNFALRIKLVFADSVKPALFRFFIFSGILLGFYVSLNYSNADIVNYLNKKIPNNIKISMQKESPLKSNLQNFTDNELQKTVDPLTDKTIKILLAKCVGDLACETAIKEEKALISDSISGAFKDGVNDAFNSIDDVDTNEFREIKKSTLESLKDTTFSLASFVGIIVFLAIAAFSFPLSLIFTYLFGIIFALVRVFGLFKIELTRVDKQIIV